MAILGDRQGLSFILNLSVTQLLSPLEWSGKGTSRVPVATDQH